MNIYKDWTPEDWQRYEERAAAYEAQGMDRSDAQGVIDAELLTGKWNPKTQEKEAAI